MMDYVRSIRFAGVATVLAAFLSGAFALFIWLGSADAWSDHVTRARHSGALLYDALVYGAPLPDGLTARPLSPPDLQFAETGKFERVSDVPRPALLTNIAVLLDPEALSGTSIQFALISPNVIYPVSELRVDPAHDPRDTVGEIIALLARYCGPAQLLAKDASGTWMRISGQSIWFCSAAPPDYRLLAAVGAAVALMLLSGLVVNAAQPLMQFADTLRAQRHLGGTQSLAPRGPAELRDIIAAFNTYRDMERQHLAERAMVLSGVSHDLGTPATRLKLRAPLIADPDLRDRIEADIDQMTGIIESVLAYTRSELSTEEPRQMSLRSLVEAIVADYADTGRPVIFENDTRVLVEGGRSIFMSRQGHSAFGEDSQIIIRGRPVALRRAISNLVDNALNYGRRATVRIETDATMAHILIEDEGGAQQDIDLNAMLEPFARGENSGTTAGFGLGLTIASTIAVEHQGELRFERSQSGQCARLSVARGS